MACVQTEKYQVTFFHLEIQRAVLPVSSLCVKLNKTELNVNSAQNVRPWNLRNKKNIVSMSLCTEKWYKQHSQGILTPYTKCSKTTPCNLIITTYPSYGYLMIVWRDRKHGRKEKGRKKDKWRETKKWSKWYSHTFPRTYQQVGQLQLTVTCPAGSSGRLRQYVGRCLG